MKLKWFVFGLVVFLLIGALSFWKLTAPIAPPKENIDPSTTSPESAQKDPAEEATRLKLLGTWKDNYRGKRTMTLNEDGTGTMVVELSGAQALLFASKLEFEMKWSLKGNIITKTSLRGKPQEKANLILNTMGNTADDTILEITPDRMFLLDKDGKTEYDWKRSNTDEIGKDPKK